MVLLSKQNESNPNLQESSDGLILILDSTNSLQKNHNRTQNVAFVSSAKGSTAAVAIYCKYVTRGGKK